MKTAYLMCEDTIEYKMTFDDKGIEAFTLEKLVDNSKWFVPAQRLMTPGNNVANIIFNDRSWDEGYAKSALQLEAMGLHGYDPYRIVRKTCGLMACDPKYRWIWFEEDYAIQPVFDTVVATCAEMWKGINRYLDNYNRFTRGVKSDGKDK